MSEPSDRPLLLVWGFMGTGKSSAGRALAAELGVPFADLDERIAARAGAPVADIFARDGEARFRELERAELDAVFAETGRRVVALGGGTLLDPAVRARALGCAFVVVLRGAPEVVAIRTRGSDRPLLKRDPEATIARLCAERAPAYAEAHATVATDALDVAGVAAALRKLWRGGAV
jgi:shikimate kinase / 3-dehydroquinate synthase